MINLIRLLETQNIKFNRKMKKQFRCTTHKDTIHLHKQPPLRPKHKHNTENLIEYEKLTYGDIQSITRTMLNQPKCFEQNMGVISSIKGKMYCLKLGEVSSSKDFSHYFYSKQFRVRQQKQQPLKKLSFNSILQPPIRERIL